MSKYKIQKKAAGGLAAFMNSDLASNVLGGVANLSAGINASTQGYTGTQHSINQGAHKLMQSLGP